MLDNNCEIFVIHVVSLNMTSTIYPDRGAQIVLLLTKKVRILDEYLNFVDIFSEKKVLVLLKHTEFNKHAINLKDSKQPFYEPIYSLGLME